MGLTGALNIGRSALAASQIGLQTAGNNIANAATPGYARQLTVFQPSRGQRFGGFTIGRGVGVSAIERQVDEAVQSRLRTSLGDEAAAGERSSILQQLEGVLNELSDFDLSSELSAFFNSWSDAANLLESDAVVVGEGARVAGFIRNMRDDLSALRSQIETQIDQQTQQANQILNEIAALNSEIAGGEVGGAAANGLRDQRDQRLNELATLMDISAVPDPSSGSLDVFVGSTPVVIGGQNRGVSIERVSDGDSVSVRLRLGTDGSVLPVSGGAIGGLLSTRGDAIDTTLDSLDDVARALIREVNQVHGTGANSAGHTRLDSERVIPAGDAALAINDPLNGTFSSLPFEVTNGGFIINITAPGGATRQARIDVDLDGITAAFASGTANDTSVADIVNDIGDLQGVEATIDATGRVVLSAEPGFTFSISDDTSGLVSALGLGGFFKGTGAADIDVRSELVSDPSGLVLGRMTAGSFVENGTALGITSLADQGVAMLGGQTVTARWADTVQSVGAQAGFAQTASEAQTLVRESLEAQRASTSGVSIDEETINLTTFQRQFQGAARLISTADELLSELIAIL